VREHAIGVENSFGVAMCQHDEHHDRDINTVTKTPQPGPIDANRLTQGFHLTPCSWRVHQRLNALLNAPFFVQLTTLCQVRRQQDSRKVSRSDEQKNHSTSEST